MENDLFTRVSFDGEALGWWDERTILLEDKKSNLLLFDVVARETSTLLSGQAMSRLLGELELPDDPTALGVISNWNGNGYDFFFALEDEKQSGESFLLKIDRTTKTLKLVNRSFKFQHSGRLDAEGTHYLYQGERSGPRGGGNGAVYLRDLSDGTVRTLVQADNGGKYALARFCASGVMYCRSNRLFWIDLNGSNNVAMFRP